MAKHPLHKMIAPRHLISQIRNAVPYRFPGPKKLERINGSLANKAYAPLGWWDIITSAKQLHLSKNPSTQEFLDYFTLCLAAHHSTVASFVPTDVDTKIRRHIWHYASAPGIIEKMADLFFAATKWNRRTVQARELDDQTEGPISGLDGEWLSVGIPALLAAEKHGLNELAEKLWAWVFKEVEREARIFARSLAGDDHVRTMKLSAILCHNAGDIDQGIDSFAAPPHWHARFKDIIHLAKAPEQEDPRFAGIFKQASLIYKHCMSREYHRNYPLREINLLRSHEDFALPLSPFLDDWGSMLANHDSLSLEQKTEILGGLIHACDVVDNQDAYYRAISGFLRHSPHSDIIHHLPVNVAQRLQEKKMREQIDLEPEAFAEIKTKQLLKVVPELNPDSVQYYLRDE